jgi:hypothetical protein
MHSANHLGELRRRASWLSSSFLVLLVVVAGDAHAQQLDPPLARGARIRMQSPLLGPDPRIGEVDRVTSDLIVFRPQGEGDVRAIPFPDIQELWISGGARPKGHRVAKMAGLGFGLGFGGSLAFWLVKGEGDSSAWGDYLESHLVAGAIGGATGAILGALGSSERWISVRIQRVPKTAAVRAVVTVQVLPWGRRP